MPGKRKKNTLCKYEIFRIVNLFISLCLQNAQAMISGIWGYVGKIRIPLQKPELPANTEKPA